MQIETGRSDQVQLDSSLYVIPLFALLRAANIWHSTSITAVERTHTDQRERHFCLLIPSDLCLEVNSFCIIISFAVEDI